jgi:glutathione S-transferase
VADIKLYGYSTSPYVRKVGCCLYYKQLPFEFVPVNPVDNSQIKFTGQTQVPVLQIDDEWRLDSTPLALWLDELFPERPLFGQSPEEREEILVVDQWISDSLIVSGFKTVYETPMNARLRAMTWRLANIVSSQTPLPDEVRNAWPQLLKTAPFIKHMIQCSDSSESASEMRDRVGLELFQHFKGGPYFAGRAEPSLLDFAIFPQLVFGYMVGSEDQLAIAQLPGLGDWLARMAQHLPENPLLVPDFMIIHSLKQTVGDEFAA